MSKTNANLGGLQDIVDPIPPPADAGLIVWWWLLVVVLIVVVLIVLLMRRRWAQWQARRRFRQIAARASTQTVQQTGAQLYRLLCRYHDVSRIRLADLHQLTADEQQAWQQTLAGCNRLRFSTHQYDPGLLGETLDLVRQRLWTR